MDYRIVEKGAFTVTGKIREVSTQDGSNLREIPAFWQECAQDGTAMKLEALNEGGEMYGICMDFTGEGRFNYMIGVEAAAGAEGTEGLASREIPALNWAVFTSTGPMPGAIQQVWQQIYSDWFPSSGYEHAAGPEMEVYPPGDTTSPEYRCEVWIPVVKKP
ncbi:GyrI-like domain-containing protein [Paenibacillus sp. VCA1]|uniref:GyrI-like domain-containing protein n=1 Tax=Paenibacillus sp. VCA1 TaxID=3039148 RepID=UPI00287114CB|nr:GyrI-like domain-containing protein [Paenibacillus sp. VCA1]MDR9853557.1 GyrI-like domain-containing protein [Paenibacillus sp. VCA1]